MYYLRKIFGFSYHKDIKCFRFLPFLLLTLSVCLYFRNHFVKVQLRPLSSEDIGTLRQKGIVAMASKLRFIPKPNGLRPIVKVTGLVEPRALKKQSREKKVFIYFIVLCAFDVGN